MKAGFNSLVLIILFTAIFSLSVFSQTDSYNLSGRISDSNSAGLAGAKVVARNQISGREFTVQTDDSGNFSFTNLPKGKYRVTTEPNRIYAVSEIRGGYNFKRERYRLSFNAGVTNLFDRFYSEQFILAPARGHSFVAGTTWELF